MAFLVIGAIAFYGSYLVGTSNFWLSFVLLVIAGGAMYAPYGPFFAIITEVLPANVSGGAIALINSFGALGSFAGSYLVGYLNGTQADLVLLIFLWQDLISFCYYYNDCCKRTKYYTKKEPSKVLV